MRPPQQAGPFSPRRLPLRFRLRRAISNALIEIATRLPGTKSGPIGELQSIGERRWDIEATRRIVAYSAELHAVYMSDIFPERDHALLVAGLRKLFGKYGRSKSAFEIGADGLNNRIDELYEYLQGADGYSTRRIGTLFIQENLGDRERDLTYIDQINCWVATADGVTVVHYRVKPSVRFSSEHRKILDLAYPGEVWFRWNGLRSMWNGFWPTTEYGGIVSKREDAELHRWKLRHEAVEKMGMHLRGSILDSIHQMPVCEVWFWKGAPLFEPGGVADMDTSLDKLKEQKAKRDYLDATGISITRPSGFKHKRRDVHLFLDSRGSVDRSTARLLYKVDAWQKKESYYRVEDEIDAISREITQSLLNLFVPIVGMDRIRFYVRKRNRWLQRETGRARLKKLLSAQHWIVSQRMLVDSYLRFTKSVRRWSLRELQDLAAIDSMGNPAPDGNDLGSGMAARSKHLADELRQEFGYIETAVRDLTAIENLRISGKINKTLIFLGMSAVVATVYSDRIRTFLDSLLAGLRAALQ